MGTKSDRLLAAAKVMRDLAGNKFAGTSEHVGSDYIKMALELERRAAANK